MFYCYVGILLLGILICVINLGIIVTKQEKDNHGYLTVILCVIIFSLMSYIAEIRADDLTGKMIAIRMELTTDAFINAIFLLYILRFCNIEVNNAIRVMILVLHAVGLVFLYSNDFHWLYYKGAVLVPENGYVAVELFKGPVYYMYMFYNFLHMVCYEWACISRLRVSMGRTKKLYHRLILAGLAPYFSYLLYATGLTGRFDVTCVGFLMVAILITHTAVHYGFEDTVSIAKDKLISQMEEGLLVADESGYYIYGNPAALDIFPELRYKEYSKEKVLLSEFLSLRGNKMYYRQHVYECSKIPMLDKCQKIGTMYLLHEITEMEHLVSRDSMTGLYNHKMFYHMLEDCIKQYKEKAKDVAIAFIDIDDFKSVNDEYGHDNGDAVILKLAEILKNCSGEMVHACRYGGEEFAMIFEGEQAKFAKEIMEKIQHEFRGFLFPFTNREFTFSCAIGKYELGLSVEEYFAKTDKLLYHIKRNGKKQILEEAC